MIQHTYIHTHTHTHTYIHTHTYTHHAIITTTTCSIASSKPAGNVMSKRIVVVLKP